MGIKSTPTPKVFIFRNFLAPFLFSVELVRAYCKKKNDPISSIIPFLVSYIRPQLLKGTFVAIVNYYIYDQTDRDVSKISSYHLNI